MKRMKLFLVVMVCAGVFLYYMGYFAKPEERVNAFVDAYNHQDMNKMFEMVKNPEVDKIKSALKFTGSISEAVLGINVAELLIDFLPISEDLLGYKGSRMYAEITGSEMDILRTEATVYAEVKTESNQSNEIQNLVFYLKKVDRTWYITDVKEM
ncbi:hypothetical protein FHE72_21835 [Rossellomorea vietnamensis]|uniref:Uncharacterized protein n=1 Tax=Rossellomorea vietnamensis TaxID=218284 RepID=A0A6I6UUL2_9BACI|nr:hypothetical protein [Rossellomorea vietnamensis]QHE63331.1 hypothetical protein FHE72_21835 [Rossellomorea vietnamensis]